MKEFFKKLTGKHDDDVVILNSVIDRQQTAIGKNTYIDSCSFGAKSAVGPNGYLYHCKVGKGSYLGGRVTVMNTDIGQFCSIAQGASISLGRHPASKFVSTHPAFFSVNKQAGFTFADQSYFDEMGTTFIGSDVWIGANAVVMDNLNIGDGAIIGAGAIVTKDVPPYAIVAGNPARLIRYRFNEAQIAFLLAFKWWDKDWDWLQAHFRDLHDIDLFITKMKPTG